MRPRLLIVEDNEALAENIAELFKDAGALADIALDADIALGLATSTGFDLAIIDLGLPGVSGVELLPQLKRACPDGELVLITGNATLDTAIAAVRQGVFAYVQKPFDPDDLLGLGQRALAQGSLKRERETLTRELAESEAIHRAVVETVPALIIGIDDDDKIQFANRFAVRSLGWSARDARGRLFFEIASVAEDRADLAAMLAAARRGEVAREREVQVHATDGTKRTVRWRIVPLLVDMESRLVLAVGSDVTDRIQLERRTAQSEAMATMGALTGSLAHEIRNPLNAAKLQLELISRATKKVENATVGLRMRERVTIVQEELSRLSAMLNDFLALARPREIVQEAFHLMPLASEVVTLMGPLAHDSHVQLGVVAGGLCHAKVLGDRAKIKQVLMNLIGNAVDAMRAQGGGRVVIDAHGGEAGLVEVTVTDTGPGVTDAVAQDLFTPFVSTKEAGTGLGLAIVKTIVELHGGAVRIERASPRGTVVRFTLRSAS